jgi:glycerol-3-phosphate acyltransferase PlsY
MTSPFRCLVGLAAGYLIGSIPFAVLLSRLMGNFDVTREGTRNPGATNVFKHVGWVAGAAVGLLDYFKALVPALLADQWLGFGHAEATAVAVGAVLGHDFSFALRFRGGKGGASTLGTFSYLDFPALMATGLLWALALPALKGRRFVAGPTALALFPILTAVHVSPWGTAHLPAWGRVSGPLPVIVGAGLVALLWARILPGLRQEAGGSP